MKGSCFLLLLTKVILYDIITHISCLDSKFVHHINRHTRRSIMAEVSDPERSQRIADFLRRYGYQADALDVLSVFHSRRRNFAYWAWHHRQKNKLIDVVSCLRRAGVDVSKRSSSASKARTRADWSSRARRRSVMFMQPAIWRCNECGCREFTSGASRCPSCGEPY